jgi:hypothetical protein
MATPCITLSFMIIVFVSVANTSQCKTVSPQITKIFHQVPNENKIIPISQDIRTYFPVLKNARKYYKMM